MTRARLDCVREILELRHISQTNLTHPLHAATTHTRMMRVCVQLIRRPMAVGGARRLLSTAKKPAFIEKSLSSDGVLTVRFDNEKKVSERAPPRVLFFSLRLSSPLRSSLHSPPL